MLTRWNQRDALPARCWYLATKFFHPSLMQECIICDEDFDAFARRIFATRRMFGCHDVAALRPQDACPGCSSCSCFTPAGSLPGCSVSLSVKLSLFTLGDTQAVGETLTLPVYPWVRTLGSFVVQLSDSCYFTTSRFRQSQKVSELSLPVVACLGQKLS